MKSIYKFVVTETVKKYVEIEAETQEEAEEIAANEDMDKNFDSYDREVTLLGATSLETINGFPKYVNGWNLEYAENMTYWKKCNNSFRAVSLYWLDTVEGDEGYNPDGDCWCVACWTDPHIKDDRQLSTALKRWNESCRDISGIMKRKEAEEWLVNYMRNR